MKQSCIAWMLILLLAGGATVLAQQQQSSPPQQGTQQQQQPQSVTPAAPAPPLYQQPNSTTPPPDQITEADNRPLSGVERLTLGSTTESLNSLMLGMHCAEMADSNSAMSSTAIKFETATACGGTLTLARTGKRGQFSLSYDGGGVVYPKHSEFNAATHGLSISQSLKLGRWTVLLSDIAGYAPESPWGGAFGGTIDEFVRGPLETGLTPDQTVFTVRSPRLSNSAVGQVQRDFTARSSWTLSAGYITTRFTDEASLGSEGYVGSTGFSWQVTPANTIGVAYHYTQAHYLGGVWTRFHNSEFRYGRRITGRMALSAFAGAGMSPGRLVWMAGADMTYQRGRTLLEWFYEHPYGASVGAFLIGADSNNVGVSIRRNFFTNWTVGTGVEYSHNVSPTAPGRFRSGYTGIQVQRRLGSNSGMHFGYGFQRQVTDLVMEPAVPSNLSRHLISMGFDFHFRPIRLGH